MKLNDLADGEHSAGRQAGIEHAVCRDREHRHRAVHREDDRPVRARALRRLREGEQRRAPCRSTCRSTWSRTTPAGARPRSRRACSTGRAPATSGRRRKQVRVVWAVNMLTDECDCRELPDVGAVQGSEPRTRRKRTTTAALEQALRNAPDPGPDSSRPDLRRQLVSDGRERARGPRPGRRHLLPEPGARRTTTTTCGGSRGAWASSSCRVRTARRTPPSTTRAPARRTPDGLRDITIFGERQPRETDRQLDDQRQRFNVTSTVTGPARWDLAQDGLVVEDHRYDDQDYMAYLAGHETPRILGKYDTSLEPTLLFASEERYRSAGLEGAATSSTTSCHRQPGSGSATRRRC